MSRGRGYAVVGGLRQPIDDEALSALALNGMRLASDPVTPPPNSADNLKTGYLVSAFKDSDDMEGKKVKTLRSDEVGQHVWAFLRGGYETVMIERVRP